MYVCVCVCVYTHINSLSPSLSLSLSLPLSHMRVYTHTHTGKVARSGVTQHLRNAAAFVIRIIYALYALYTHYIRIIYALYSGVTQHLRNAAAFSKVSALVYSLYKATIERTFENFCLRNRREGARVREEEVCQKILKMSAF